MSDNTISNEKGSRKDAKDAKKSRKDKAKSRTG